MKMLNIAYYTVIRNLRDKKSMANMLLLPIILILILGNALSSTFEVSNIDKTEIYYINNDNGHISQQFDQLIESDDVKSILNVKKTQDKDSAINEVKNGKVSALVLIDSGVTDNIMSGKNAEIQVYEDSNNSYGPLVVENLVKSFTNGTNASMAAYKLGNPQASYEYKDMVEKKPITSTGKIPKAIDYYAVTMLVLILMYGSLYSLYGFAEDYLDNMKTRLLSSPANLFSHFSGKILGTIVSVFAQALVLILFTKYVYKANWGTDVFGIIFITLILCIFTVAFGVMMVILIKNKNAAGALVQTLIPVMTFVSGGYAKIVSDNKIYNAVKLFMPSNLGQTAYFNTIYGDTAAQTNFCLAVLGVMILAMAAVASVAGRRRLR